MLDMVDNGGRGSLMLSVNDGNSARVMTELSEFFILNICTTIFILRRLCVIICYFAKFTRNNNHFLNVFCVLHLPYYLF